MKIKKLNELNETEEQGKCYVFIQGNDINEEHYYDLVRKSKNDELILYPERAMTFVDVVHYRPYLKSIVTENPYIISCYSKKDVYILDNDEWVHPTSQTYGCSVDIITDELLKYNNSIPLYPMGGASYKEKIKKLKSFGDDY